MAQSIHISTLRKMLKAGDPVDLKLWTKSGEIQEWRNCVPLRYNLDKFGGTSAKKQAFLRSVCTNFLQRHAAVQAVELWANSPIVPGVRVHGQ